ncbi:biotin transporter BioY [Lacticaseibacillus hulanensis]|uniref:biotin transporter BioY n=1 Tax=Lacticaseibacillus hulanensis TaxID=2493111 RepID=UPI000FD86F1B|nr:ECF transporter S component [Lacticaseibacillus hulanensis]
MKNREMVRQLTATAMMLAVLLVLGLLPAIPIGVIPVPILLQNMGVMLAGLILGPRFGTVAVGLLLLLVALGLPVLSGGRGGAVMFVGPTAGYLLGYCFVPVVVWLMQKVLGKQGQTWWGELLAVLVAGVLVVDLSGTLWLMHQADMPFAAALVSNLAFIPGDILKAALTVIIARRLKKTRR